MAEEQGDSDGGGQEKKHAASEHKRHKARERGQVARAPDIIKLALVGVAALALLVPGSLLVRYPVTWITGELSHAGTMSIASALGAVATCLEGLAGGLLLVAFVGGLVGLAPGGWSASMQPLAPDVSRLNPAKGLKSLFAPKRLVETLKAILKFAIIGGAGSLAFLYWNPRIDHLPETAAPNWSLGLHAVVGILAVCVVAAAAIVVLDVPLQKWIFNRDLRMTDRELRDEQKETEVSPLVRRKLRQAQIRLARARMMEELPRASVVAVNPTHYAVALRYRRGTDIAPVMVAKGAGLLAQHIREVALQYGVPVVAAPPLARALYHHGTLGETVPNVLYRACAEVLAYVWRLDQWAAGHGAEPEPPTEADLGVDKRLDPGAEGDA
ncbi:MAG TPA: flagellar type III secretion system protein FlhB [Rhodanobacteraceae bacterium]